MPGHFHIKTTIRAKINIAPEMIFIVTASFKKTNDKTRSILIRAQRFMSLA